MELKYARIEACDFGGRSDCYLLQCNDERFYIRFPSSSDGAEFCSLMTDQIQSIKAREASEQQRLQLQVAERRANLSNFSHQQQQQRLVAVGGLSAISPERILSGVNVAGLALRCKGPRARLLYRLLLSELDFMDSLGLLNAVVVQPLMDASKGAALQAVRAHLNPASGPLSAILSIVCSLEILHHPSDPAWMI